ncbi:MAG TPA: hypothetical protein VLH35_06885, partial [Candidatus Acidoferrales bacterium]|nr:hypothetical protein [Candidatus Acidoferrales bacterium]
AKCTKVALNFTIPAKVARAANQHTLHKKQQFTVTHMTQSNVHPEQPKPPVPANQAPPQIPPVQQLEEQRIKEVIMETLIELDLISKAQKRKSIKIE